MRVAAVSFVLLGLAGCGLFLDDLSTEHDEASVDAGPREDAAVVVEDARANDAAKDADADAPDVAVDAPKWVPRLDCDGAIVCEGFEGITAFTDGMPAGLYWDQVDEKLGNASIETNDPALGMRAASFVSPANGTGEPRVLLIGDNDAGITSGNATRVVEVDFDLRLDYVPTAFDGSDRRNLVGIFIPSSKAYDDWEYAGLSVMTNKGLHAEIRQYDSSSSTTKKIGEDPFVTLTGQPQLGGWHHFRLVATFAKTATGGIDAYVDGVRVAHLEGLVTKTNTADAASRFIFWIGASAGIGAPALTAVYDDVEVRTR